VTQLSEKETEVLAFFVEKYHNLVQVPEPYRTQAVFSTSSKKECMVKLSMKSSQLNFIFTSLRKKRMLLTKEGITVLQPMLQKIVPGTNKLTYEFLYS
jgi:hypothetical protein